jgi:hypothetical protein
MKKRKKTIKNEQNNNKKNRIRAKNTKQAVPKFLNKKSIY